MDLEMDCPAASMEVSLNLFGLCPLVPPNKEVICGSLCVSWYAPSQGVSWWVGYGPLRESWGSYCKAPVSLWVLSGTQISEAACKLRFSNMQLLWLGHQLKAVVWKRGLVFWLKSELSGLSCFYVLLPIPLAHAHSHLALFSLAQVKEAPALLTDFFPTLEHESFLPVYWRGLLFILPTCIERHLLGGPFPHCPEQAHLLLSCYSGIFPSF